MKHVFHKRTCWLLSKVSRRFSLSYHSALGVHSQSVSDHTRVKTFCTLTSTMTDTKDHNHTNSTTDDKSQASVKSGRVFAISDLHVDYKENLEWVSSWPKDKFTNDALIVAGDVTDKLSLLDTVLRSFCKKFARVYFCSGNHELWIRPQENCRDSVMKHQRIMNMCERIGVHVKPSKFELSDDDSVWIVPLQSWYATPEEDRVDSLHLTHPTNKDDVKTSDTMWMDNHLCKWPSLHGKTKSKYFASLNDESVARDYDSPVISFSHMVPRKDLIPPTDEDRDCVNRDRCSRGMGPPPPYKPIKGFNFTRYAGSHIIETQLRKLGSRVHIYGHQHRNRDRTINGVRYVSHCLGNKTEQAEGDTWGISHWQGPKLVWPLPEQPTDN